MLIDDFVDQTGKEPDPRTKGVSSLLADHLVRMRNLYLSVDGQTIVVAPGVDIPVRDAIVRTEDVGSPIKDAVTANTTLEVGLLKVPIGALLRLFKLIVRGPRIVGELYKEGDTLILTAQTVGCSQFYSWRVEQQDPFVTGTECKLRTLDQMVEELSCRIFTDIALLNSVRWRAVFYFNQGLREYRKCLRTRKDIKTKLKRAEKAFMQALADDERFEWAYYNLGLVYTGLGQLEAAAAAFLKAVAGDQDRWETYYALAQIYFEANKQKNHAYVVALCERVFLLQPNEAKGYRLLCRAQYQEALRLMEACPDTDVSALLEKAARNGELATANAWVELCRLYVLPRSSDPDDDRSIEQQQGVARDCMYDLATTYLMLAERASGRIDSWLLYRRSKALFRQARLLCPSDPDLCLELGRVFLKQANYEDAIYWFRFALRIDTTRADIWAYVSLTSDVLLIEKTKAALLPLLQRFVYQSRRAVRSFIRFVWQVLMQRMQTLGLLSNDNMGDFAWKELLDRTCDASPEILRKLQNDFQPMFSGQGSAKLKEPKIRLHRKSRLIKRIERRNDVFKSIQSKMEEGPKAIPFLEELRDKHRRDLWCRAQLDLAIGRLYREGHKNKEAENQLKAAIALFSRRGIVKLVTTKECQETSDPANLEQLKTAWEAAQLSLVLGAHYQALAEVTRSNCFEQNCYQKGIRCYQFAIETLTHAGFKCQIRKQGLHAVLANALLMVERRSDGETQNAVEALQQAERAVELDPLSAYERGTLSKVYTDLSELEQALSVGEEAQLTCPGEPSHLLAAGNVYLKLARESRDADQRRAMLEKAACFLEQALDLYRSGQATQKGQTYYILGHVCMEWNDCTRAVSHFRGAVGLGYAPLTAHFSLAWALLRSGQFDDSVETFTKVIHCAENERREDGDLSRFIDADYTTDRSRPLGLILTYAYVYKIFSFIERDAVHKDFDHLIYQAEQIIEEMKLKAAEKDVHLCRQAVADCKGWRLLKQERIDEAIDCLKQAVSFYADPEAYYHLALAYEAKLLEPGKALSSAEKSRWIRLADAQCKHALNLDVRREFLDCVQALQSRLRALEPGPPPPQAPQPKEA